MCGIVGGLLRQPLFNPTRVRALFNKFTRADQSEQVVIDNMLNWIVSMTLTHERFGMS